MTPPPTRTPNAIQSDVSPILRWAGSKRLLLDTLADAAPESYTQYVEPFAGSLSLFFRLRPSSAVLGDLNTDLVSCYRTVRQNATAVSISLRNWRTDKQTYLRVRRMNPQAIARHDRAARFIYLNKLCFNGLYRTNSSGQFNVPYSGMRTGPLPTKEQLQAFGTALRAHTLVAGDFERTLMAATLRDAFVYLDPPYAIRGSRMFREYGNGSFSFADLERFSSTLKELDASGAKFLVSYASHFSALPYFRRWNQRQVRSRRNVGGFASRRRIAQEVLVTNY